MARPRPAAALLLSLALCGAALAAPAPQARPTLLYLRQAAASGSSKHRPAGSVSVAAAASAKPEGQAYISSTDSYEHYGAMETELCLQEVSRRACDHLSISDGGSGSGPANSSSDAGSGGSGQEGAGGSGGGNGGGGDKQLVHKTWTSDVTCCRDKSGGRTKYNSGAGRFGALIWNQGSIGSCDWTVDITAGRHNSDNGDGGSGGSDGGGGSGSGRAGRRRGPQGSDGSEWGVQVGPGIRKVGKASALCYFGADSEECGGPFCERMMMTLEGVLYHVEKAYSAYSAVDTAGDESCEAERDQANGSAGGTPENTSSGGGSGGGANASVAIAASLGPSSKVSLQSVDGYYPHNAGGGSDGYGSDGYGGGGYYRGEGDGGYQTPAHVGSALVINGVVTALAGPRKEKWDDGVFEYTLAFQKQNFQDWRPSGGGSNGGSQGGGGGRDGGEDGQGGEAAIDPNSPWVTDKAMKFTFYRQPSY